jgi:hypothetical protein
MSWFGRLFGKQAKPPAIGTPRVPRPPADAFTGPRKASREVLGLMMSAL